MKRSKGKESHAFVLDARKAWRASSGGAAGPVPAKAAIERLLFGQIMPQTFNIMMTPNAPPTPMESVLLLAKLSVPTVSAEFNHVRIIQDITTTRIKAMTA
jgi:hypothetical protein